MRSLLLLLLLTPAFAWAQEKRFEITGSVKGLPANSTVYIADVNYPTDTIAAAKTSDGKFTLKGSLREPGLHHLVFAGTGTPKKALLFIGNDKMKVEGNIDDVKKLQVTGSESHNDFIAFQTTFNPTFERLQKSTQDAAVSFTDADYEALQKKLDSFLLANKDSYVSPFVLVVTSQLTDDISIMEKRYNALEKNVQQGFFGKYVKELIDDSKIGAIGSDAIDFTQNDTAGKAVTLSSFRGKYVLVDFWASWCGPCRQENPNVVAAHEKFKSKNFTILGVSLDRSKPAWIKAIADDHLDWTHVSDLKFWSNEAAAKYKIQSIPQNYLIDPGGKIIARNLRGEELQTKLCEVLGCN